MEQNDVEVSLSSYWKIFLRNNIFFFTIALIGILVISCLDLVLSWIMQRIIDIVSRNDVSSMVSIIQFAIFISIVYLLTYCIYTSARSEFLRRASINYKKVAFDKLTKKSISAFHLESTSIYVSALTNDVNTIEENYIRSIFRFINLVVTFLGAVVLLLYNHVGLTILTFLIAFIPILISFVLGDKLTKVEQNISEENAKFVSSLQTLLNGFMLIKSFHAEKQAQKVFQRQNEQIETAKKGRSFFTQMINMLGAFNAISTQLGVFLVGGYLSVTTGSISVGTVFLFLQLTNYLIEPVQSLPLILSNRRSGKALLNKLKHNLEEHVYQEEGIKKEALTSKLELKDLSFSYDGTKQVLSHINMLFEMKKSYAIVGPSGSGKSTLLHLLQKGSLQYDGEILFDDLELKEIQSDSIYEFTSMIQQHVFVFDDTLKNNITMYQSIEEDRLHNIIKDARLEDLVEEKGLEFPCGENGCLLSGGEKQRISIARALSRNASMILVDEATSSLDSTNAMTITNTVLDMKDTLRIVVTHRLEKSILERYDQILVIDHGTIKEMGTFQALMGQKGQFFELFEQSTK